MDWKQRISLADREYQEWEQRFQCKLLQDYYEGFQWKHRVGNLGFAQYRPYTLNMVFSTIEIKLSNFLFKRPSFVLSPEPGNSDWDIETAIVSCQTKQDVLNMLVKRPAASFKSALKRCALDSFFRFGVMEVGYAADWRNPNNQGPVTKNAEDSYDEDDSKAVSRISTEEVPENERIYFKHIKAEDFRVSANGASDLNSCSWFGYYEYYYTAQLKRTKGIKWPGDEVSLSREEGGVHKSSGASSQSTLKEATASRVFHLWDMQRKKRLMLLESEHVIFETEFERSPIQILRWHERIKGFYPLPPVFNWLSPQDEINESREQLRSYRRRFTAKYQMMQNSVDQAEVEKFTSGEDGVVVTTKMENAIKPIENPSVGPANADSLLLSKDDFNNIAGTSAEQRGQSDRETATATKIKDAYAQIRESAAQMDFGDFTAEVGRETLQTAIEKMSGGFWVEATQDPGERLTGNPNPTPHYALIQASQLMDGYDYTIKIDPTNVSPISLQAEQGSLVSFLSLTKEFPEIMMSPTLLRKTAYVCGFRDEKYISELQRVGMLQLLGTTMQTMPGAQGQGGEGGNNVAKGKIAQTSPNTVEETRAQLDTQMGAN